MKFVLLSPRRGTSVLAAEYDDFLTHSGLIPEELEQRSLEDSRAELGSFEGVDGVFIGGSPFTLTSPFNDPEEAKWQDTLTQKLTDFIKAVLFPDQHVYVTGEKVAHLPVFSVCFGAGMLAANLGGKVTDKFAESAGGTGVVMTPAGRTDPVTRHLPDQFTAMTGHKDSVEVLPESATLLLTGNTCPHQMYRLGKQVWVSQFHPEMDGFSIARRLNHYMKNGYFKEGKKEEVYSAFASHDTTAANTLLRSFVDYVRRRQVLAARISD